MLFQAINCSCIRTKFYENVKMTKIFLNYSGTRFLCTKTRNCSIFYPIGEIGFPWGGRRKNCYEASINPEFGSTLARRLNHNCFPAVLHLVRHLLERLTVTRPLRINHMAI